MTLTNHIRRIEELAGQTLVHVQEEEYPKVLSNLESIRGHLSSAINIYFDIMRKKGIGQHVRYLID